MFFAMTVGAEDKTLSDLGFDLGSGHEFDHVGNAHVFLSRIGVMEIETDRIILRAVGTGHLGFEAVQPVSGFAHALTGS